MLHALLSEAGAVAGLCCCMAQAAAAQVVQETAASPSSPLEQLQATMQGLWQQVTHTGEI